MFEPLIKLVGPLLQLLNAKRARDRYTYTDFVEPSFHRFQHMHDQYVDSFTRYRQGIESTGDFSEDEARTLVKQVSRDAINHANILSDVFELHMSKLNEEDDLASYIKSLIDYVKSHHKFAMGYWLGKFDRSYEERVLSISPGLLRLSNAPRTTFVIGIADIVELNLPGEKKRELALLHAEDHLQLLQEQYRSVVRQHNRVKERLLSV